eukprot:Platyproteum_vivax@DN1223_c0_g1_i1.p1
MKFYSCLILLSLLNVFIAHGGKHNRHALSNNQRVEMASKHGSKSQASAGAKEEKEKKTKEDIEKEDILRVQWEYHNFRTIHLKAEQEYTETVLRILKRVHEPNWEQESHFMEDAQKSKLQKVKNQIKYHQLHQEKLNKDKSVKAALDRVMKTPASKWFSLMHNYYPPPDKDNAVSLSLFISALVLAVALFC